MKGGGVLLAVVLVAALSAGCLGGSDEPGTNPQVPASGSGAEERAPDDPEAEAGLQAPTWQVGQWWRWDSRSLGEYTYVVTEDQRDHWFVETDNPDTAFFDAQNDISFLGPVRKSDLAGSQGETRVEFFDWPLTEGKTWSTTWDGVTREITVTSVQGDLARLEAHEDGRLAVAYEYDARTEGFGHVSFYNENGTAQFEVRPTGAGENWTGEVARWSLETVVDESGTLGPQPATWGGEFEVPENTTDVYLQATISCPGNGAVSFGVNSPDTSQGQGWVEACPFQLQFAQPVSDQPAQPGMWTHGFTATGSAEGSYDVQVLLRNLELAAFGG